MMVTINVPKKSDKPMLRCGFLISPAINVTLFHASELKMEPTIAEAMAPTAVKPRSGTQLPPPLQFLMREECCFKSQEWLQLSCHTPAFAANKKPNRINPNNAISFANVNVV